MLLWLLCKPCNSSSEVPLENTCIELSSAVHVILVILWRGEIYENVSVPSPALLRNPASTLWSSRSSNNELFRNHWTPATRPDSEEQRNVALPPVIDINSSGDRYYTIIIYIMQKAVHMMFTLSYCWRNNQEIKPNEIHLASKVLMCRLFSFWLFYTDGHARTKAQLLGQSN